MLLFSETRQTKRSNLVAKRASLALLTALAVGSAGVPAMARSHNSTAQLVNARQFRADAAYEAHRHFVPVNGAQIMGGFGGPGDLIDNETGEILRR